MRRLVASGIAVACLSLLAPLTAHAESATASESPSTPHNILQLGDSYSAGNGAQNYTETNCYRSPNNYGAVTAERLGASYTNRACSGAQSKDFYSSQSLGWKKSVTKTYVLPKSTYPDQPAEWQRRVEESQICGALPEGNFTWDIRQVAPAPAGSLYTATAECHLYALPQLDAVTPDYDSVFLTIGGNDANFFGIIVSCFIGRDASSCQERMNEATVTVDTFRTRLTTLLRDIDERAAGNADIYLLSYPDLLSTPSYMLPEGPAGWFDAGTTLRTLQARYTDLQSSIISDLNKANGTTRFHLVDIRDAFDGHGLDPHMAASQDHSWISAPFASTDLMGYMHPTPSGWAAEADTLTNAILAQR